jgi:hypothetical protein
MRQNSVFFLVSLVVFTVVGCLCPGHFSTSASAEQITAPIGLSLNVDKAGKAYISCNGVLLVVALGDFFEFYNHKGLRRNRIAIGPFQKQKRNNLSVSRSRYTLQGYDPDTGAESVIVFAQTAPDTAEVSLSLKAPRDATNLSFDVAKVAGYISVGAEVVSSPQRGRRQLITDVPPVLGKHVLLRDKTMVTMKTSVCDIEISDLDNRASLQVADMRGIFGDRYKGIKLGVEGFRVVPGSTYDFRYRLRVSQPSLSRVPTVAQRVSPASRSVDSSTSAEALFLSIPAKKETHEAGFYGLTETDVIFGSKKGAEEEVLRESIRRYTGLNLSVRPDRTDAEKRRGIVIDDVYRKDLPPEGFGISVSQRGVVISGADARGLLYGVHTLSSRLRQQDGAWGIPFGDLTDWPDLPVRGMCIELLSPALRDVSLMKRYLLALSKARCNLVIFLHMPHNVRAWQRGVDDGGWTKKQMTEIVAYARSLQMEVWGGMTSKFTASKFPEMGILPESNLYDPFDSRSYDVLFSLYDEVLKLYSPSVFLICHDEITGLDKYLKKSDRSPSDILAMDIARVHDWLSQRKTVTAIFGDMLLDHQNWESRVGHANSQNPAMKSGATHFAIGRLPKDVLVVDWHYDRHRTYPSIGYFRENGLRVFGANWFDPVSAGLMAKSVALYGGSGVIGCDWGLWRTLSPSGTTLYNILSGWSTHLTTRDDGSDVEALGEALRSDSYLRRFSTQVPVSLEPPKDSPAGDPRGEPREGLFGLGPAFGLRNFPRGEATIGGVRFRLGVSVDSGFGDAIVLDGSSRPGAPSTAKIELDNRRTNAIAFLHTCLLERPQTTPRKIGEYLIRYTSGRTINVPLLENFNITDIRSVERLRDNPWKFSTRPDVLTGSAVGWSGVSTGGIPVNLQTLVWTNPYPGEAIQEIGFRIVERKCKLALLGLTCLNGVTDGADSE